MEECGGCGLRIAGGAEGCQALFDEFRAREMSELAPGYASTRLTVDVYCLQHPDRYCVSAKSLAAHLAGVGWAVERGGGEWGLRQLQRWLDAGPRLQKPALPERRGALTIAGVAPAATTADYVAALDRWARSTWSAYADLHDVARRWIDAAVGLG
ncbi:MAG TPA: DUF5946 family protein [Candidatus Dormibacteraeota bacterium]|nr:DUF5946 family protein [Candidatus Dormibacteraeota bacterium]